MIACVDRTKPLTMLYHKAVAEGTVRGPMASKITRIYKKTRNQEIHVSIAAQEITRIYRKLF